MEGGAGRRGCLALIVHSLHCRATQGGGKVVVDPWAGDTDREKYRIDDKEDAAGGPGWRSTIGAEGGRSRVWVWRRYIVVPHQHPTMFYGVCVCVFVVVVGAGAGAGDGQWHNESRRNT